MKKLRIAVAAIFIATGALGTYAFTTVSDNNAQSTVQDPHWFDVENGEYLGQRTQAQQDALCGGSNTLCAQGYEGVDENDAPAGDQIASSFRN